MDYELNIDKENVHLDFVALHFSTRCGAGCKFCYFSDPISDKEKPTPIFEIEKILNKLKIDGVKEVLFVGGDPVIHPHFFESLQLAKSLRFNTYVLSNSWNLRPLEKLGEILSLIDFCEATLLGANETTHDILTNNVGGYNQLIRNLKIISNYGKEIGICANVVPQNLNEIYDIINNLINKHHINVKGLMIQRIIPSGKSSGDFKFGLNLSDVSILMKQIDRISNDFGIQITFEDPVPWCTVDPIYHKYLTRCEWGYSRGSVNSVGELNRCGADDVYRLGSIFENNIQDTWNNNPILKSFRSKEYLADECKTCSLLELCGGGCPLSCGTLNDHSIDQLYIQKVTLNNSGDYKPFSPTGVGLNKPVIRHAYRGDLDQIVALERELFLESNSVFQIETLNRLFEICPKAFRVVVNEGKVLAYLAIFPLNEKGLKELRDNLFNSVISMDFAGICKNFNKQMEAIYIEVVGSVEPPNSHTNYLIMKNLIESIYSYRVPVFTCPITDKGMELAIKLGFEEVIQNDKAIYVKYSI